MKARCSALPVLQYCAKATAHDTGSARAAAMGTAFHALCSGDSRASDLLDLLSPAEAEEVKSWKRPATVELQHHVQLRYEDAQVEVPMGADAEGNYCDINDERAVLTGHADMYWRDHDTIYLGDIKKTRWGVTEGTNSLQLHAYALILCAKHGSSFYKIGIWVAEEGEWIWGDMIDAQSMAAFRKWAVIQAILDRETTDEYSTGPHCRDCYSRLRCPAYMVEGKVPVINVPPEEVTNELALDAIATAQRLENMSNALKDFAQAWGKRNGGIRDGNGKVYRPINMPGKETGNVKALKEAGLLQYVKRGLSFEQWRWVKV